MNMRLLAAICILFAQLAKAQVYFPSDPDSALLVTEDIPRFWKAYDSLMSDTARNPFDAMYIRSGSPGVRGFLDNRIQNADHLRHMVLTRTSQYEASRERSYSVHDNEGAFRSAFYAFKYLYPSARFPPVYFVIGACNSGGTSKPEGLILGMEMEVNGSELPGVVAHELIHFQQQPTNNPTLLQQAIFEGVADFIGQLISGINTNSEARKYAVKHKDALCREFVARMNQKDFSNWMYGKPTIEDRPSDLGYWMGYEIANAYYQKKADKKQAIADLINVKDAAALLRESGYLSAYLE